MSPVEIFKRPSQRGTRLTSIFSPKGTPSEKGGRGISGLNRAILYQGGYELRRQLEYKQVWLGGQVVVVNLAYTRQTCACCGLCIECGYKENADINGARNILAAGHAVLVCEVNGASVPSSAGTGHLSNQSVTL